MFNLHLLSLSLYSIKCIQLAICTPFGSIYSLLFCIYQSIVTSNFALNYHINSTEKVSNQHFVVFLARSKSVVIRHAAKYSQNLLRDFFQCQSATQTTRATTCHSPRPSGNKMYPIKVISHQQKTKFVPFPLSSRGVSTQS